MPFSIKLDFTTLLIFLVCFVSQTFGIQKSYSSEYEKIRLGQFSNEVDLRLVQVNVEHLKTTKECENCDLRKAVLNNVNLEAANLKGANLQGSTLIGVNLKDAKLIDVNLNDIDFSYANLEGADREHLSLALSINTQKHFNLLPSIYTQESKDNH